MNPHFCCGRIDDLHVMVALKEVCDLSLTEFGVTEFACRSSSAENKFSTFFGAGHCALVGVDQLFDSILVIDISLTLRKCQVLTSF